MTHATENAYQRGCRCEACRQAHTDYRRAERARAPVRTKPERMPVQLRHGIGGYGKGCRCERCREAKREAGARSEARRRSGVAELPIDFGETPSFYRIPRTWLISEGASA